MVRTTQAERQEVLDTVIGVFNAVIEDHHVDGRTYTGLREQDVKLTQCTRNNKHGHFYCYDDNTIKLGVNYEWWWEQTSERRLVFLLHEFTHKFVSGHPPRFWERHDELVTEALAAGDEIEEHIGELSWREVQFEFANSVNMAIVDHRYETVMERRREIAHEYGLPIQTSEGEYGVDLFGGVYVTRYGMWNGRRAKSLQLSGVDYSPLRDDELIDWLASYPEAIFVKNASYHVTPVDVAENGYYRYEVEDDARVAAFLDRVGESHLPAYVD